jgi:DTW domain-containing protein YfiP
VQDCATDFVILIHPKEFRRRIATGRMAHLMLPSSRLLCGHDYSGNAELSAILGDPARHCLMLYPGPQSRNLSTMSEVERFDLVPEGKRLTLLVIDGTWATARKMVRLSRGLADLPRVCFTPTTPSNFRIRRQPRVDCYSTIEAIHHAIELLGGTPGRAHDRLLSIFEKLVNRQLELAHSQVASSLSSQLGNSIEAD